MSRASRMAIKLNNLLLKQASLKKVSKRRVVRQSMTTAFGRAQLINAVRARFCLRKMEALHNLDNIGAGAARGAAGAAYVTRKPRPLYNPRRPFHCHTRSSLALVASRTTARHPRLFYSLSLTCVRASHARTLTPWPSPARWTVYPASRCWRVSALAAFSTPHIKF